MKENMILNNLNLRKSSMTVRSFMTLLIMLTMTMVVNVKSTNAMYGAVTSAPVEDVYILGEINGKGWVTNDGVKMTRGEDGIYTAIVIADGSYGGYNYFNFTTKLSENSDDWDAIAPYRFGAPPSEENYDYLVTDERLGKEATLTYGTYQSFKVSTGKYDLALDLEKMTLVITRLDNVYILGDINENNWASNVGVQMTHGEDGLYTATITVDEGEGHYFGFTMKLSENDYEWEQINPYRFGAVSNDAFWVTDEQLGKELALQYDGPSFRIEGGEYELTLDLAKMTLIIKKVIPPTDVFILGNIENWNTNEGQQMTRSENGKYTATLIADGYSNGFSYFSFTTKLMEEANDWDGISPYRFGAVSNGDFWVTDETLGQEISLTYGGQAFRVPAGKYNLTLDLVNLKLVVTAAPSVATEIDQVSSNKLQETCGEWFTIDGSKLSGKPAKKGVYIHNGKKVVMLQ